MLFKILIIYINALLTKNKNDDIFLVNNKYSNNKNLENNYFKMIDIITEPCQ